MYCSVLLVSSRAADTETVTWKATPGSIRSKCLEFHLPAGVVTAFDTVGLRFWKPSALDILNPLIKTSPSDFESIWESACIAAT